MCELDDEAVTTSAFFPNARAALTSVGAAVRTLPLSFGVEYGLQLDNLRAHLSPKLVWSALRHRRTRQASSPRQTIRDVAALMADLRPRRAQ